MNKTIRRYSFLENNQFRREKSYDEKQLRELFNRGRIDRETELWLWDGNDSRLAGTYESLFIRNRRFKERRLGIFGAKNSGKTSFLHCCMKFGTKFDNGSLLVTESIPVFFRNEILAVEFSLLCDEMTWEIQTQDYDGELIKTTKIEEWFAECDAVLLLIDGTATTNFIEEMREFLDQLRRNSSDGNRIDKPIAIVWTKSDLYEIPNQQQDIRDLVETFVNREFVESFCVSIFKPGQIIEPIYWSVRKIDEMKVKNATRLTSKQELLNEYRNLRDVWGINRGELGKEIEKARTKFETEFRRRTVIFWVNVHVIIFVSLIFFAIFVRIYSSEQDERNFRSALQKIELAERPQEVESILEQYRKTFFSTKNHLENLHHSAQIQTQKISVRKSESAFRTATYTILNADSQEKIEAAIEKFRRETTFNTTEQLDKLTALATERRKSIQFQVALSWEQNSYEKFRKQADSGRTAGDLKNAAEFAKQYLVDTEKRAAFGLSNTRQAEVEKWLEWFEGLKSEHSLTLTIKTIEVQKSFFKAKNLEGKIIVTLQIGETKTDISIPQLDETQKNSDSIRLNLDLKGSVENAVWDEKKQTKITLTVAEYLDRWRYFGYPVAKAVCEVSDSEYPYIEFNPMPDGIFVFTKEDSFFKVKSECQVFKP